MSFTDQLKQLVELHRVAELAMKDLIIRLWPTEAMPSSYFRLVRRVVNACPRLDVVKRSACIEGARMTPARCKMWWAKMDTVEVTRGAPEGKVTRQHNVDRTLCLKECIHVAFALYYEKQSLFC